MYLFSYGFNICQPYDRLYMVDGGTVFAYTIAVSLMWKNSYWGVYVYSVYMCVCVCVCVVAKTRVPTEANKRGCSYLHLQLHTRNTSAVCVCERSHSHIFVTFVCDCLTMFVCVYILNVCVCVCVAPARPWGYRQLGDSADGITYDMWVTEWVCVCMCVYVCVCVCAFQSIWAPLWPTGAPSAHCGPLGSQRDDREWERAARPAYLHPLSPQPTLTKHAIFFI